MVPADHLVNDMKLCRVVFLVLGKPKLRVRMQAVAPGMAEVEVVAPDSVKLQAGASRSQVQEAQAALPEASTSAAQVSLSCWQSNNRLWCLVDVRVAD